MARPTDEVTVRFGHHVSTSGIATIEQRYAVQVERWIRPRAGVAEERFRCAVCGEEFVIPVHSLESLVEVRRRRRFQGLAGLGAGVLLAVVAVLVVPVAPAATGILAVLAGLAVVVSTAHLLITPHFQGANTLIRAADGKTLALPGTATHRLL